MIIRPGMRSTSIKRAPKDYGDKRPIHARPTAGLREGRGTDTSHPLGKVMGVRVEEQILTFLKLRRSTVRLNDRLLKMRVAPPIGGSVIRSSCEYSGIRARITTHHCLQIHLQREIAALTRIWRPILSIAVCLKAHPWLVSQGPEPFIHLRQVDQPLAPILLVRANSLIMVARPNPLVVFRSLDPPHTLAQMRCRIASQQARRHPV